MENISWSKTSLKTIQGRHIWIIEDIEEYLDSTSEHSRLDSTQFEIRGCKRTFKFKLRMTPQTKFKKDYTFDRSISLEIEYVNCEYISVQSENMEFKFELLSTSSYEEMISSHKLEPSSLSESISSKTLKVVPWLGGSKWTIDSISLMSPERSRIFFANGNLVIVCHVKVFLSTSQHTYNPIRLPEDHQFHPEVKTLNKDVSQFLSRHNFKDVTLICQGKQFEAHKAILSARSDVFHAMFTHDKSRQEVEIKDMSSDAMEKVLEFIYSDKVTGLMQHCCEIFVAADKYNLSQLMAMCERYMMEHVTTENVCEYALLASRHSSSILLERCMDFLVQNIDMVVETDGWHQFAKSEPEKALEVTCSQNNLM